MSMNVNKISAQTGISTRLRTLMDAKGLSIKKFSDITGVPYRTVQNYLGDERSPGAEVLIAICTKMGVSADWLLLGEGPMERGGEGPVGAAAPVDPLQAELAELRSLARRGAQAGAWRLLTMLEASGVPTSQGALASSLGVPIEDVESDLALLRRVGRVAEVGDGWVVRRRDLKTSNPGDGAQLALAAVDVLLSDVLPAADRQDGSGRLIRVEAFLPQGRGVGFAEELLSGVEMRLDNEEAGPERVTLVVGLHIDSRGKDG